MIARVREVLFMAPMMAVILFVSAAYSLPVFYEHTIDDDFDGAWSVFAIDLDDDGDIDVLGAAEEANTIAWWENDGSQDFTRHTIDNEFTGARDVLAADLDGDGDIDVVGAASEMNRIHWWENDGNQNFTWHAITINFMGAYAVNIADFNGDNFLDVVGASNVNHDVKWWRNNGNGNFAEIMISNDVRGASSIAVADMDYDDDLDILSTANTWSRVIWWSNNGGGGFTRHLVDINYSGARDICAADMDNDSDMDMLTVSNIDDDVTWWENDSSMNFTEYAIEDEFDGACAVMGADLDGDSLTDVIAAAMEDGVISWWRNERGGDFNQQILNDEFFGASDVHAVDLDGDDDLDVLGSASEGDKVSWWENTPPHPPNPFSLVSPADSAIIVRREATFVWNSTDDVDPDEELTYSLYIATNENLTDPVVLEANGDTTITYYELEDSTRYWWKAHAQDMNTSGRWSEEIWSFEVEFMMRVPYDLTAQLNDTSGEVTLTWSHDDSTELNDLIEFLVFRNDVERNWTTDTTYTDQLSIAGIYFYKIVANYDEGMSNPSQEAFVQWNGFDAVETNLSEIPGEFKINSVYPNPFNSTITVALSLPQTSMVKVSIWNVAGQETAVISEGILSQGSHRFLFNADDYSSGVYFIHAVAGESRSNIQKVLLIR